MSKTKTRQEIYFEFYDKLPWPINIWARTNYDDEFSKPSFVPDSIVTSICQGFNWIDCKIGNVDFWDKVQQNTSDKSKLLKLAADVCRKQFYKCYDQIDDKIAASKARYNYDKRISELADNLIASARFPFTATEALLEGFNFRESPEGFEYWDNILENLREDTPKKTIVTEPMSKRKQKSFEFYDILPNPINTWAKENFDETFSLGMPQDFTNAITCGWNWKTSKNQPIYKFWMKVCDFQNLNRLYGPEEAVRMLLKYLPQECHIDINSTNSISSNLNQNSNEKQKSEGLKVRKFTPSISTGERRISNPIQGARSKTSIAVGYLSNAEVSTCS